MRTNPIGTGTRNLSVNAPIDWVLELGRAAVRAKARSVGDFARQLLELGARVRDPVLALKLREARRQYYGAALAFIFVAGLVASWFAHDGPDMSRRARGRTRGAGTVRVSGRGGVEDEVEA